MCLPASTSPASLVAAGVPASDTTTQLLPRIVEIEKMIREHQLNLLREMDPGPRDYVMMGSGIGSGHLRNLADRL